MIGYVLLSWCDEWLRGDVLRKLDDVWEVGHNVDWYDFFTVIGMAYSYSLLTDFVGLQWEEAFKKNVNKRPLLRSEERKNIVLLK